MTKIVEASCENQTVTVDGVEVTAAEILSQGDGSSTGLVLIDKEKVKYITSNASDISDTIDKVIEAINKVATILTSIGAGMTGPTTAPPPTLATDVAALSTISTDLSTLKGQLK